MAQKLFVGTLSLIWSNERYMTVSPIPPKPGKGYRLIFRARRTVKGQRLYAKDYGYRAWAMWVLA